MGSFFQISADVTLSQLAEKIGCTLSKGGEGDQIIQHVGPIENIGSGGLTFFDNPKYKNALRATKAMAVICSPKSLDDVPDGVACLIAEQPYKAFATAMSFLFSSAMRPQPIIAEGISAGACIDPTAILEEDVTVEHGAVIGAHAQIGRGSLIGPNAIVGRHVCIGRNSSICSGATVVNSLIGNDVIVHSGVRMGCDGFGFAMGAGGHQKIPQIGRVIIQDKVEIGANTCIDRGSNRDTVIGEGTKIDNLVMIAHNVKIGCHCVIVGQTGIAGSAELGDYVVLGGQAAVNGHVKIGSGSQMAGLSAISGDVPPGSIWGGVPARPIKHWMRGLGKLRREAFAEEKSAKQKKGNDQ